MLNLLALANRYGFSRLHSSIEYTLSSNITKSNVLQMWFYADMYNANSLREKCLDLIDSFPEYFVSSPSILELPMENLKLLLSRDSFIIDELAIFETVKKWKDHNSVDVDEMRAVLGCVCLSEIPYKDIVSSVSSSNLFSNEIMKEAEIGSGGSNPRGLSGILNINM